METNVLGGTPEILAYNSGHFYPGSNTRDWWRYAIPGFGNINWGEYISHLQMNRYVGVLSIEVVLMTPDGRYYTYNYQRRTSDLYVMRIPR